MAVLAGSGYFYFLERKFAREHAPAKPAILPAETKTNALDYEAGQSTDGRANFSIKARRYQQIRDTPNYELEGLELKLMQKDQKRYDLIKSAKAEFNQEEGRMYSDGAVEITLDVPVTGAPAHKLTSIRTSGVTFDSKSGKATTGRHVEFTVENGEGQCSGASYDPSTHQLHLEHDAEMTLRGTGPHSKPMKIQAGEIVYQENGSLVTLGPWSRMIRAETTIDAAQTLVHLGANHKVESIDAAQAKGVDHYPSRDVHYSADKLLVSYDGEGAIRSITGTGHAFLRQESDSGITETHADVAGLDFRKSDRESILQHVSAKGGAQIESRPKPDREGKTAESRTLKADTISIDMRPDGKEIDRMVTDSPATLELLPNAPDQHRRFLTGDRMTVSYGARNQIKELVAVNSTTLTYPVAANRSKNAQPSRTASRELTAAFDEKGQLSTLKQSDRFSYEEGERHATAESATLDQGQNVMDLNRRARIWDSSGTTAADRIHINQKTGDYAADGHVTTSRMADQDSGKKQGGGEMLDGKEPIQGTAPHMTSANHNKVIHYDGGAVLWQGGDRIEAQAIDIDRDKHQLTAEGKVVTQFRDEQKDQAQPGDDGKSGDKPGKGTSQMAGARVLRVSTVAPVKPQTPDAPAAAAAYTVVTSDHLLYTDTDRQAHYSGQVALTRPGLNVKTDDLRAFLNPRDTDQNSRLNRAYGKGAVLITESRPDRQRIGRGAEGEYITAEDKIVLKGNLADLYDSLKKDDSHGTELTYFTSDDRLLINGGPSKPVSTHLQRKKHANANPGNR